MRRGFPVVLIVALAACSGAPKQQPAPSSGAPGPVAEMEPVEEPAESAPEPEEPAEGGVFGAITTPKLADQEYIDAIALVQESSGAKDAAADLAAGRKRLLGIPQDEGRTKLPGVTIPRDRLPADVTIARVQGIMDGTDNRHAIRYEMFVSKYVLEYNQIVARSLR